MTSRVTYAARRRKSACGTGRLLLDFLADDDHEHFEAAFDKKGKYRCDVLATPTTPTTAFEIGAVYGDSVLMQYADLLTVPANHAGTPGISIPCGLDTNDLPLGLQILANDWDEATMLRVAAGDEQLTADEPWRRVRPTVLEH